MTPKKILFGFWGGAPNTDTTVPYRPAKVFLGTWDGGVCTAQCGKMWGFGVALQARISLQQACPQSVFGYLVWGCLHCAISDAPILGIQKDFGGHIWCRGMRPWSATPKSAIFFGIAQCKHSHTRYPKTARADLAQRYARLERHPTFFGIAHSK